MGHVNEAMKSWLKAKLLRYSLILTQGVGPSLEMSLNLIDEISKFGSRGNKFPHFYTKINFHISKTFLYISDLSTPTLTPIKAKNKAGLVVQEQCLGSRSTS